jgi:hypothetical protein
METWPPQQRHSCHLHAFCQLEGIPVQARVSATSGGLRHSIVNAASCVQKWEMERAGRWGGLVRLSMLMLMLMLMPVHVMGNQTLTLTLALALALTRWGRGSTKALGYTDQASNIRI